MDLHRPRQPSPLAAERADFARECGMTRHFKLWAAAGIALGATSCAAIRERPSSALSGLRVIEDVNRRGIIDNSWLTLSFAADETLTGTGGCNRINGRYHAGRNSVSIASASLSLSRKNCAPALMHQDAALMAALAKVSSYRIDDTGALVLTGAGGTTVLARRP